MKKIGIYKITSPIGRVYIGQSVDLERRLNRYKNMNKHTSTQTKIWRSLLKYGPENHSYEIIEICNESMLNHLERKYQEIYDSVENGLNCVYTKSGDKSGKLSLERIEKMRIIMKERWKNIPHPFLGRSHSTETREKIRQSKIGKTFTDDVNKKKGRKGRTPPLKGLFSADNPISKSVIQMDLCGNIIRKWDSATDVKRSIGISNSSISMCCNGKILTAGGYKWSFNN